MVIGIASFLFYLLPARPLAWSFFFILTSNFYLLNSIILLPISCVQGKKTVYFHTMNEIIQVKRFVQNQLPASDKRSLVLVTGARQTGKTTLLKKVYHNLPYYNLDAIEYREQLSNISSFSWADEVGSAIIDEIQKEPGLADKIKFAFDEGSLKFSALSGSSQILLLKKMKETLAGRVTIFELFPFLFTELFEKSSSTDTDQIFRHILKMENFHEFLKNQKKVILGKEWDDRTKTEEYLLRWGGMPPVYHLDDESEKQNWLRDYSIAYLERDVLDLARLSDLKPFKKYQQLAALRSANLLSYSELARDAAIATETARRYLEYLRISYQAFLIMPYHKNLTSQIVKTPKLYWFDNGILRHLSGIGFNLMSGQLYENYIAAEIMKYLRSSRSAVELTFYRTRSGMEIDFILAGSDRLVGIEVKNRKNIIQSDFTGLKKLSETSGTNWAGGIVLYRGNHLFCINEPLKLWAIPSCRFF